MALVSPLAFSLLPWLLGVLLVFVVGIAIEAGPGLALEFIKAQERAAAGEGSPGGSAASSQAAARVPTPVPVPARSAGASAATSMSMAATAGAAGTEDHAAHARDCSLFGACVEIKAFRVVERSFASYKVAVTCPVNSSSSSGQTSSSSWSVWKRYSDFEDLRESLDNPRHGHGHGGAPLPLIPPKTLFKNLSPKFLAKRAESLEAFVGEIVKRRDVCDKPAFRFFLDAEPLQEQQQQQQQQQQHQQQPEDREEQREEAGEDLIAAAVTMPHSSSALTSVAAAGMPLSTQSSPEEEEGEEEGGEEAKEPPITVQHHQASRVSLSSTDGNEVEMEVEDEDQEDEDEQIVAAAAAVASGEAGEGITYATEDFPDDFHHKSGGVDADCEEEDEEEDELRSSGDQPTLSTASTDDGMDDEERASRTASHIMETVRALSTHSPSEWGRIVPSSSSSSLPFLSTGDAESATTTAEEAAGEAPAPPPAGLPQLPYLEGRYAGMSLEKYASLGLRVQHPYAYYDPGNGNTFRVRGKHYLRDGRKFSAGPPVGKLVLACVFKIPPEKPGQREDHMASRGRMAEMLKEMQDLDARDGRPPFLFLVNFQVPGDPPLSMVTVFALPRDRREEDGCFWTLLDRFLDFPMEEEEEGGEEGGKGGQFPLSDFKNKRFKLIPSIAEGPSMIKWAVGNKPTILGQKLTQRYFRGENYVEVDVDIASSALASQIVGLCRGYAKYLKVEMGIVLQGEEEGGELPEKLLGTIGITNLDINAYGREEFLNVQVEEGVRGGGGGGGSQLEGRE